eukprot:1071914-Pyramimonas_sp.AAC.1
MDCLNDALRPGTSLDHDYVLSDSMKTHVWEKWTMVRDALVVNCNIVSKCESGYDQQRTDFIRLGEPALAD